MASEPESREERLRRDLFSACRYGTWKDVVGLLQEGASLEWRYPSRWTPFHQALRANNTVMAERILDERKNTGFDNTILLNGEFVDRDLPLHMACELGHETMVDMILRWGGDMSRPNKHGDLPVHVACMCGNIAVLNRLVRHPGFDVDILNCHFETPLLKACLEGQVDIVRKLLDLKADVNRKHPHGVTPLHVALTKERWSVVHLLLQMENLDVNAEDASGYTPLHRACYMRKKYRTATLKPSQLASLPNTYHPDSSGEETTFHDEDCQIVIQSLLQIGAEVSRMVEDGKTPLYFATEIGDTHVVRLLLRYGAKPRVENSRDCIEKAEQKGFRHIVRMLRSHTEDTN